MIQAGRHPFKRSGTKCLPLAPAGARERLDLKTVEHGKIPPVGRDNGGDPGQSVNGCNLGVV